MQDQLRELLTANAVRVIDLFREWDEDGNGLVDKKEFRKAMVALGVDADCDDAVASTYSGAPDSWYDGVDADCGGDSDYDADGDGDAASLSWRQQQC